MLKAKNNPFATERVDKLNYHFSNSTIDELVATLIRCNYCGAIVGPEGSGKTTLLLDLSARLKQLGIHPHLLFFNRTLRTLRKHPSYPDLRALTGNSFLLVDGAEQLGRLDWWRIKRFARRCRGLVITAHQPGKLPTLYQTSTNITLLADIVNQLMGSECGPWMFDLNGLYNRHNGNLRLILRELYDHCAKAA